MRLLCHALRVCGDATHLDTSKERLRGPALLFSPRWVEGLALVTLRTPAFCRLPKLETLGSIVQEYRVQKAGERAAVTAQMGSWGLSKTGLLDGARPLV